VKNALKYAGRAVAGMLPAALLVRLGMPALAALVFLVVLVLGVICWIIGSGARSDRVTRMILAWRGDARCLMPGTSAPPARASRRRRRRRRPGETVGGQAATSISGTESGGGAAVPSPAIAIGDILRAGRVRAAVAAWAWCALGGGAGYVLRDRAAAAAGLAVTVVIAACAAAVLGGGAARRQGPPLAVHAVHAADLRADRPTAG
jgi:hypothetical protein